MSLVNDESSKIRKMVGGLITLLLKQIGHQMRRKLYLITLKWYDQFAGTLKGTDNQGKTEELASSSRSTKTLGRAATQVFSAESQQIKDFMLT